MDRLEQEDLGVADLLGNASGDAQIFKHFATDRLRLLAAVQVCDPLPNLPAFGITLDDFPSQS